jgi:hypothetical protein
MTVQDVTRLTPGSLTILQRFISEAASPLSENMLLPIVSPAIQMHPPQVSILDHWVSIALIVIKKITLRQPGRIMLPVAIQQIVLNATT